MWLALALVAIVCAGTVFMIRFLIALLRESAPSVCYWVIPSVARGGEEAEQKDFETDVEFGLQNLARLPAAIARERFRVGRPWEATARSEHWHQGGKQA